MTLQIPDPVANTIKWAVAGLIIFIIAIDVFYIAHLQSKVANQEAAIKSYQQSNIDLGNAVDTCNAGVRKIKDESDARAAAAEKAAKLAQVESDKISQQAEAIMKAKPTESDDCKATKAFLDDYYRRMK